MIAAIVILFALAVYQQVRMVIMARGMRNIAETLVQSHNEMVRDLGKGRTIRIKE